MKIGVIGASGKSGSMIVEELITRNYSVTGIVRNSSRLRNHALPYIEKGLFQLTEEDLKSFDVIVHAFATWGEQLDLQVKAIKHVLTCINEESTRLIVVGGAGSLYVDDEKTLKLKDKPDFPSQIYPVADIGDRVLTVLKNSSFSHWTYFSPAEEFLYDAEKTGKFFWSDNTLPINNEGKSQISYADYAIALADEIEEERYIRKQCSVCANVSYSL